ncbi:hypothetical protein CVT24_000231 [Panaeolus cyanescens]|uniref:Amidohydrolase-related domain-containing protein n=1 Tax=Panaeolus cyanescens TaxID=181874 RepID=A0A409VIE2_9AGAR|nr:hypothetical protein CVT24_000231 [Panaeolus cyanescens]
MVTKAPQPQKSGSSSQMQMQTRTNKDPARRITQILAGQLFDSVSRSLVPLQVVTVDEDQGIILDVAPQDSVRSIEEILGLGGEGGQREVEIDLKRVNLSTQIILPGLVDVHVHFFLHPYSETSWEDQVTRESLAERTIRATVHARKTLMAGFTTVRDLGTEGALDADIALRKSLSGKNPIIPGPRYYCSTRAIVASGSYGPRNHLTPSQNGVNGVTGAEAVDGADECAKEVRKQIGAGADWIKIYADYRVRAGMGDVAPSIAAKSYSTFSKPELQALITTAHRRGVKVAAHANTPHTIRDLLDLEVDSVEHGPEMYNPDFADRSLLRRLAGSDTIWVPTLSVFYTSWMMNPESKEIKYLWERCQTTFKEAIGVGNRNIDTDFDAAWEPSVVNNIACGGDTGVFAHGKNALELVLMRRLGAKWNQVLGWATFGGWRCIRGMEWDGSGGDRRVARLESMAAQAFDPSDRDGPVNLDRDVPFGVIRPGWAADLVGVEGKLDGTAEEFEDALTQGIKFVMKGGRIYKNEGTELV